MLADEIAEGRFAYLAKRYAEIAEVWRIRVGKAQIVVADNVSSYAYQFRRIIDLASLPTIAPPFPGFVVEFRHVGHAVCVAFNATEIPTKADEVADLLRGTPDRPGEERLTELAQNGARWIVQYAIFERHGEIRANVFTTVGWLYLDHDSHLLEFDSSCLSEDGRREPHWEELAGWLLSISLLAVSFMHCTNIPQHIVAPPPKLSKRHKERHGRPLFSYRVLEIGPMERVLRTEGHSDEVGLARALHICRGHFKDYRERGLFGRNKGLYWWDHHVRGSIEAGIAAKDYAVKAPK